MSSESTLHGLRELVTGFRKHIERLRQENHELRRDVERLVQESMRPMEDPLVASLEEEIRRLRAQNKGLRAQLQSFVPSADASNSLEMLPTIGMVDSEAFSLEEVSAELPSEETLERSRWTFHMVDEET